MKSVVKVNGVELKGMQSSVDLVDQVGFIYYGSHDEIEFDLEHNVVEINIFGEVGERLPGK